LVYKKSIKCTLKLTLNTNPNLRSKWKKKEYPCTLSNRDAIEKRSFEKADEEYGEVV